MVLSKDLTEQLKGLSRREGANSFHDATGSL